MPRTILVLLSEYGYWGEELLGPVTAFDKQGYETVFTTPTGKRARALPVSMDPGFIDPPLGRSVTTAEVAVAVQKLDESDRLDNPLSIGEWVPERPYLAGSGYLRSMEAYNRQIATLDDDIARYDALTLVGGSGPIVDMANNGRVHELILAFVRAGKPVLAECYGVACLAFARDWEDRASIISGKHVTGHCKEYDYKDGTGFLGVDFNMGPPPYPLEYILRDATAPGGRYHGNVGKLTSVIVDYPFVTGRSTPDSFLSGEKLVEVLESGLRRYGWLGGSMIARPGKFAIFEQFAADGITKMFGNPGTSEEGFLDVVTQRGEMDYILTLQETVAIGVADGYARASGRPALVQLHAGVGLGNGIGMMYQALRGHSPLVVIAGEAGLRYEALDAQMAADLVSMARPVTKWATRVVDPGSVLRVLRRAVKIAMTHPRGPVFVDLPLDLLDLDTLEPAVPSTIPSQRVVPASDELGKAVDILRSAQRPLIIIGDDVSASGAQAELTAVAELLNAPVWGACDAEANMDATHPLYQGQLGHMFGADSQRRLEEADAVLIVGTYVFPEVFPLLNWPFRPGARIVHIDLDTYEIGKNFPVNVALAADPKATLAVLADELAADGQEDHPVHGETRHRRRHQPAPAADAPLIELFAAELARQTTSNLVVFDEALTASASLAPYLPATTPGSFHATRGGSLGVGIPGAIGVKIARPDAEVVSFSGDGGSMYTFQGLWTAARHDVNARFVVCNNRRYQILDNNIDRYWSERQIPTHGYPDSFDLSHPEIDFAGLARSLGVSAERVDKPAQVEAAVTRMLGHPGPYLVDLDTE